MTYDLDSIAAWCEHVLTTKRLELHSGDPHAIVPGICCADYQNLPRPP